MSSPVPIDQILPESRMRSSSGDDGDLQSRMQQMLDMQSEYYDEEESPDAVGTMMHQPAKLKTGLARRASSKAVNLHELAGDPPPSDAMGRTEPATQVVSDGGIPNDIVGKGTLFFPDTYHPNGRQNSKEYLNGTVIGGNDHASGRSHLDPTAPVLGIDHRDMALEPPNESDALIHTHGIDHSDYMYGEDPEEYHDRSGSSDVFERDEEMSKSDCMEICDSFCCICRPIMNILMSEQLHRSFCFGAIDGMLTGSGIVSAFCGLGVLNLRTPWEIRLAIVAFASSACVADSICMAISHVWTCYVVSTTQAQEREREREIVEQDRANAKGKLVDMLLARGMLKIDAMSLADTLEGYPEMFIGTLVGEPLLGGIEEVPDEDDEGVYRGQGFGANGRPRRSSSSFGSRGGVFSIWRFPSYGQFDELEHDPDVGRVNTIVNEGQREGFFMMLGFAIFAIIPSLLWLFLPLLVATPEVRSQTQLPIRYTFDDDLTTMSHNPTTGEDGGTGANPTISLPSLVFSISAVIMWSLGVWKSKFMDSNWLVFGVETIVVLLVCVSSAYGMGSLMLMLLGENYRVQL